MRKGFTAVEIVIIVMVAGLFLIIGYGAWNRITVESTCVSHGYVKAGQNRFLKYCTKVENGNTVMVHVDSLRNK